MDDSPDPEPAPPSPPTTRSHRAAKGKGRAAPAAEPTASAGPQSKRRRAATPELESPVNDDLFAPGSGDEEDAGNEGDDETHTMPEGPEGMPRVEVEAASPSSKERKVVHLAMGSVSRFAFPAAHPH